jgi:hypothetical protein
MELIICKKLDWKLTPVTAYEIMNYMLLYSAAAGETLKELIIFAQIFIDCAMCEYSAMKFSPAVVALSGILQAHTRVNHCPKQWLNAIKELNLFPTEDENCFACCSMMQRRFNSAGITPPCAPGIPQVATFFRGCQPVTPSLQVAKKKKAAKA